MKTKIHFWSYLAHSLLEWEMLQSKVVEKIETHNLCSVIPPPENHAVCEIMWKKYCTLWHMRIAFWIPKATNTHTGVLLIAFPLKQWLHKYTSMLRYTYIACLALRICMEKKVQNTRSKVVSVFVYYTMQACDTSVGMTSCILDLSTDTSKGWTLCPSLFTLGGRNPHWMGAR